MPKWTVNVLFWKTDDFGDDIEFEIEAETGLEAARNCLNAIEETRSAGRSVVVHDPHRRTALGMCGRPFSVDKPRLRNILDFALDEIRY
jgi:hypothetical protein